MSSAPAVSPTRLTKARLRHIVFADASRPYCRNADLTLPPVTAARPPAPGSGPADGDEFLQWLLGHAGIDLTAYRREPLRRRVPACLRALRVANVTDARCAIERHAALLDVALNAALIGTTAFFRDPEVFTSLQCRVLPMLCLAGGGPRVWSVGCSDGAELYSMAILLAQMQKIRDAVLLGSDVRADAVEQACRATFHPRAMNIAPDLRARYFMRCGDRWAVMAPLRRAMRWRVGNVLSGCEGGGWDVILCRNLAIYLSDDAVARLWRDLRACLRPGGVLVVGKAERPSPASGLVPFGPCSYARDHC